MGDLAMSVDDSKSAMIRVLEHQLPLFSGRLAKAPAVNSTKPEPHFVIP